MLAYVLKRTGAAIATLVAASIVIFIFIHLIPGDPIYVMLGDEATPEQVEALRTRLGLDRPLYVQYFYWAGNVLQGDLGNSIFFQEPVTVIIRDGAETSLLLACVTMVWIVALGVPVGVLAAIRQGTWVDQGLSGIAMLLASIPTFWVGLYLILIFAAHLGWLPSSGYPSIFEDGGLSNLRYLLLPSLTLAAPNAALILRLTRASMLDVAKEDYVRTARAKGLGKLRIILRHVAPNAILPIIAMIGIDVGLFMSGIVVVESVFGWPGIGQLAWQAIQRVDIPIIMGVTLVSAFFIVLGNLLADLIAPLVDPRIKLK